MPSLDAIDGLIGAEMAGEIGVAPQNISTSAMHQKQRGIGPLCLNRDEAGMR